MLKKGFLPVLIVKLILLAIPAHAEVEILAGPYLQAPGETSMTVMWVTGKNCYAWVEYGTGVEPDKRAFNSRHGLINANGRIHTVEITGLQPGTEYHYRICSREIVKFEPYKMTWGETGRGEVRAFSTLDSGKETVSFLVLNDLHEKTDLMIKLLSLEPVRDAELTFLAGDILNHLEEEQQVIDKLLVPATNLLAGKRPFLYARGNHETRGRYARSLGDYVKQPGGNFYYSFDHGPVRFVVMDTGEDKEDTHWAYAGLADFDGYRDEQREWLKAEIASEAFQTAAFRVLITHFPIFESGDWHGPIECRTKWGPLLEGKIDLQLCGHTHRSDIHEPNDEHSYAIIVGGDSSEERATIIRVDATEKRLQVLVFNANGKVIDSYLLEN